MRARDIMTRPVHTVRMDDTVERAAAALAEWKITAAPVLDEDERVVGIVSDGDLLWHRAPAGQPRALHEALRTAASDLVSDVMTKDVVSLPSDADVSVVAQAMLDLDIRSVPIVDQDELVGIISRGDIVRSTVRTNDTLRHEVQHRLDEYAGGQRRWIATVENAEATITGQFDDEAERQVAIILAGTVPGISVARIAD